MLIISFKNDKINIWACSGRFFKILPIMAGVYKYKGKVTDNGTTALLGNSVIEKDEIKIGNSVFKLSPKAEYVKGFIGRYVEFYAVKDKEHTLLITVTFSEEALEVMGAKVDHMIQSITFEKAAE